MHAFPNRPAVSEPWGSPREGNGQDLGGPQGRRPPQEEVELPHILPIPGLCLFPQKVLQVKHEVRRAESSGRSRELAHSSWFWERMASRDPGLQQLRPHVSLPCLVQGSCLQGPTGCTWPDLAVSLRSAPARLPRDTAGSACLSICLSDHAVSLACSCPARKQSDGAPGGRQFQSQRWGSSPGGGKRGRAGWARGPAGWLTPFSEALTSFWHQAQPGPDSMQSRQVLTLYLVHSWDWTGRERQVGEPALADPPLPEMAGPPRAAMRGWGL